MEYIEQEDFNGIPIERWRKAIKFRRSGVREIYVSDNEIIEAHEHINEKFRPLFKLLVYSGARLSQAIEGVKRLDHIVIKGDVCRIPINSVSRGKKKAYWLYIPCSFLDELKRFASYHNIHTYRNGIMHDRVSASTIRKWNLNFLVEQGIPESVCDFIQGRASVTVGSTHYLAKTQQADVWYAKAIPKLLEIFE